MYRQSLKQDLLLYGITDRTWLNGASLYSQVECALKGGVTFLQLREKNMPRSEILKEALIIKELCHKYKVPLIINDDVELAVEADADGVHVGQKDMEAGAAREKLGPEKILGVSARTVEQALTAEKMGADYLGVGAIFGTNTKSDARKIDNTILSGICSAVNIPVVAIGGIKKENISELSGSGISGVAVISGIFGKNDIESAAIELKELAKKIVN
ncbi:MAG: thiamine phosphate synthase [Lachnospiraceae bacterium]|nr:thiamine phosphate synthase [Lachnospiraceae bacterium]